MDSESSAKFSFAFLLAILFHLLLVFLLILGLSFPSEVATKKAIQAMQATIVEIQPDAELPSESPKKLSRAEKKQLAQAKQQTLRLTEVEKKNLLASAAQKLVIETLQAQKLTQEIGRLEVKVKRLWTRPAMAKKGMACVIKVQLSDTGQIKKAVVTQSSGNKLFDDSAKEAVYKAQSFQFLDDEIVRQKMQAGVSVHFGDE